jgi:hypothetical protein
MTNSLWSIHLISKNMMSMLLSLFFTCLAYFGLWQLELSVYVMYHFPESFLIIARFSVVIFPRFSQNLMLFLSSRNRIRPNIRLQIKGRRKSSYPPSRLKFCSLTQKIYITIIIYRCIAILQLLYRWQYHSSKWWIPLVYCMYVFYICIYIYNVNKTYWLTDCWSKSDSDSDLYLHK